MCVCMHVSIYLYLSIYIDTYHRQTNTYHIELRLVEVDRLIYSLSLTHTHSPSLSLSLSDIQTERQTDRQQAVCLRERALKGFLELGHL